jgi:Arc-like DNA binding domain
MAADKIVNLNVRMPASLHAQLVEQAHGHRRSLNSQVVALLAGGGAAETRDDISGLMRLIAAAMDTAGRGRFGLDALYAPESTPKWIDDASGYDVAAAAAARVLDALKPAPDATAARDPQYAQELAETNQGYGAAVAEQILDKIAGPEPSDDPRTTALREALGSLLERINPPTIDPWVRDLEPHWIAPMTPEQRARHKKTDKDKAP